MKIGVLAVQGNVREHISAFRRLGVEAKPVLRPEHFSGISGIVLPGGESTAMWRIMVRTGLAELIAEALRDGLPAFGTCAGMVLLAQEIVNWPERYFGVLDIAVERNASGRQVDSFETQLVVYGIGEVPAIFIRAPIVRRVGKGVEVLAEHLGQPVMVQKDHILAASFHPELTPDVRVHEHFLTICRKE